MPPAPLGPRASHSPEEGRPVSDEELAWRLMQEEQAQFQQRMMALAGLGACVSVNKCTHAFVLFSHRNLC